MVLTMRTICPNCGSGRCFDFYTVYNVPTNSCLLVSDRQEAVEFPVGDIVLCFCQACGFIFNAAWQPERTVYSEYYEETQGFSPTFNTFHRHLAEDLINRYSLFEKEVFEIGCGKGEFLSLICDLGRNRGVGYDPSFVPTRFDSHARQIRFVREFFTETTSEPAPDFVCCKMTLEHVAETARFIRAVRRLASAERGTIAFFQIPDVRRIIDETAFWDIYYEHCSYFAPSSVAFVCRDAGFEVLRVSTGYNDQYLTIDLRAVAGEVGNTAADAEKREIESLGEAAAGFAAAAEHTIKVWQDRLRKAAACSRRTVLWGSGSKAVSFLTTAGITNEIEYVVDINPHRQGRFVPKSGHRIIAPEALVKHPPDTIVAMNSIYLHEIEEELARLGISAELVGIDGNARSFNGSVTNIGSGASR